MKALTPAMIALLKDCYEREQQQLEPLGGLSKTQSVKGLINRGLLSTKQHRSIHTGSMYPAFFITDLGKAYIKKQPPK